MKHVLQIAHTPPKFNDDSAWQDEGTIFPNRAAAEAWYNNKFSDSSRYDWRVGWLIRTKDGIYYRIRRSDGKTNYV